MPNVCNVLCASASFRNYTMISRCTLDSNLAKNLAVLVLMSPGAIDINIPCTIPYSQILNLIFFLNVYGGWFRNNVNKWITTPIHSWSLSISYQCDLSHHNNLFNVAAFIWNSSRNKMTEKKNQTERNVDRNSTSRKKKLFLIRFVPSPIVYVAGGYLSRLMARDDWELSQNTHSQCVWNTYRVTWKLYCLGSKVAKQRDTNENKTKQSRRDSNEIRLFDKVSLFSFKITNWNQNWHVQHPSAA